MDRMRLEGVLLDVVRLDRALLDGALLDGIILGAMLSDKKHASGMTLLPLVECKTLSAALQHQ
jgi:hypothetical protein